MNCPRFAHAVPLEKREQGMPGARCTRGLVCKMHKEKRTRAYRFSGGSPAFPAQWFYGLCRALPGDEFVLSPSLADYDWSKPGWVDMPPRSLAPATGVGTTRFCRTQPAPFVLRAVNRSQVSSPCDHLARRRCRVHRIPSRVRDDRDPPLLPGKDGASW